jgi:rod shape-determining protein MreD
VRRAVLSVIVLAVALLLQLTFVNQLQLPAGGAPDLVLLTVVALALFTSPATGAVTGFCAGLALDLAPPGSYLIGEYALVFCLIGYLCGRIRPLLGESAVLTIAAAMAAAAVGDALSALIGRVISDPDVTWAAVRYVLPSSIVEDVILAPFLLYAIMRAVRLADGLLRAPEDGGMLLAHTRPALAGGRPGATVLGGAGLLGGAGWVSGPQGSRGLVGNRAARRAGAGRHPRSPRLRGAAARPGDGWIGGTRRTALGHTPPRPAYRGQPPRLHLSSGHRSGRIAGGIAGHPGSAAARAARPHMRSQPDLRLGARRRRDGSVGRSLGSSPPPGRRAGSGPPGSAFRGPRSTGGRRGGLGGYRPPSRDRRFRPDRRLRGGSAMGGPAGGGPAAWRQRPVKRVSLRFGSSRRRGGVIGGSVIGGRAVAGGIRPGTALRGGAARPVALRLGAPRRRDGVLAGLAPRRRFSARRRAVPRFRSGPSFGRRVLMMLGAPLRPLRRRRTVFGSRRRSLAAGWSSRSSMSRIGTRRTGGF